jgi:hypothetical protein
MVATSDFVQNLLCGGLHIASALIIATTSGKWSKYNRQIGSGPWQHACCVDGAYDDKVQDCSTNDKYFYSVGTGGTIPVLALTVTFAMWSGIGHMANLWYLSSKTRLVFVQYHKWRLWVRALDYIVSAPLMLLVLNVLWGALTKAAIFLAPCLQAAVIAIGAYIQLKKDTDYLQNAPQAERIKESTSVGGSAVAVGLYGWAWSYSFRALADAPEAPSFLIFVLITLFLIFSSFAAVYFYYFHKPDQLNPREFWMNTLSAIAKLVLHAFVAISLFQQEAMLHTKPPPPGGACTPVDLRSNGADFGRGIGATLAITIIVWGLNRAIKANYTEIKQPTNQSAAKQNLLM